MALDRALYIPLLDADVLLRYRGTAVLQQLLHKSDVIAVVPIDLGSIELAKAVGTDPLIAEIVANHVQRLLHRTFRQREDNGICRDVIIHAVAANELIQRQGNSKHTSFACLLFNDREAIALTILYYIAKVKFQDIRYTDSQVRL